jgi:hypothetical protein
VEFSPGTSSCPIDSDRWLGGRRESLPGRSKELSSPKPGLSRVGGRRRISGWSHAPAFG